MRRLDGHSAKLNFFPKPNRWKLKLFSAAACLVLAALLLLDWCFVRYRLLDETLAPAFWGGQKVVTFRLAYWLSHPQRNDMVIYSPARDVFKPGKLLGVAGDVVALEQGKIILNGSPVPGGLTYGDISIPATKVPQGFVCLLPGPEERPVQFRLMAIKNIKGRIVGNWQVLLI